MMYRFEDEKYCVWKLPQDERYCYNCSLCNFGLDCRRSRQDLCAKLFAGSAE